MKKKVLTAGKCFCATLNIWGLVSTTTTYELGSPMSFVASYRFSKFKVILLSNVCNYRTVLK